MGDRITAAPALARKVEPSGEVLGGMDVDRDGHGDKPRKVARRIRG